MSQIICSESDVFYIPHLRMKELITGYIEQAKKTDFTNFAAVEALLCTLRSTFTEVKYHEDIEETVIIGRLQTRLESLCIDKPEFCNCHSNSPVGQMITLIDDGYSMKSKSSEDCLEFGLRLQKAVTEFPETFYPHMREEEKIFQPLLDKYFNRGELQVIRKLVAVEHYAVTSNLLYESMMQDSILDLPDLVMTKIFSFLTPPDLGRCAQVCQQWNNLVYQPALWKRICPVQWAHGQWSYDENWCPELHKLPKHMIDIEKFHNFGLGLIVIKQSECEVEPKKHAELFKRLASEYRVISGLVRYALCRVGGGVKELNLGASCVLNDELLNVLLLQCPNVTTLDVSHTALSSAAFHGIQENGSCRLLTSISFAGCEKLEDSAIMSLLNCWRDEKLWSDELIDFDMQQIPSSVMVTSTSMSEQDLLDTIACITEHETVPEQEQEPLCVLYIKCKRKPAVQGLRALDLSGCCKLTNRSIKQLAKLSVATQHLSFLDLSGCFHLTARVLNDLVQCCPALCPEHLSYCDNIVDGPYSREANGCNNLQCTERICCVPYE
ncbi:F-box/LRR-repeat protein 5-like [Periplaneta americana]|uniref:F-box/LRR-repeat protein 5-like n=1 Tax=Periplaneta americana TaxID=6978 RepID=UPI0037E9210D